MGGNAKGAVPALVEMAKDEVPETRAAALHTLAGIGADARDALPTIRAALAQGDRETQWAAARAMMKVAGPAEAAGACGDVLLAMARDRTLDAGDRGVALREYARLHAHREGVAGHVAEMLDDEAMARAAVEALAAMGPAAAAILPPAKARLRKLADDRRASPTERWAAARLAAKLEGQAR